MPDDVPVASPNDQARAQFLEGLRDALQDDPRDAELWYQVGNVFMEFGDYPTAAACFQAAIQEDPKLHKASIALTVAGDMLNEPPPRKVNRKALVRRVTPVLDEARAALERGEAGLPKVDWSLTRFRRLVDRRLTADPRDLDALFLQASLDLRDGKAEEALRQVNEIIRLDERYPGVWFLKAEIYERMGNPKLASECRIKGHSLL